MRKIEEVLRLHHAGCRSNREIAQAVRVPPTTVADYLRRARQAGLTWPLADSLTERAVEAALFPPAAASRVQRPEPDWAAAHRQLGRSGVTLELLWQEYRERHPDGYQYSAFCLHYRAFAQALPVTLRQSHAPGEQLFVDYSGQTVPVIDAITGEEHRAQIFVAVLGASNYSFVEATWSQGLADWLGSHVRCLEFLGGVPELLVPDNLKSAVKSPSRYEPDLNPSYAELAAHYGVTVLPARVRKPRDKAKVEAGVLLAQRWILARLRHRRFFGLDEVNRAIRPLLAALNRRPFKRLPGRHTTVAVHLAPAHQAVAGWNAPRFLEWAAQIGPHTQTTIERVLRARAHPQQGYRTALGIQGLRERPAGSGLPARRPAAGHLLPQPRFDPPARSGSPDHRARPSRFAPPARQRARPFLLLLRKPPCSIILRANV